jgi:hypothetical protein
LRASKIQFIINYSFFKNLKDEFPLKRAVKFFILKGLKLFSKKLGNFFGV